MPANAEGEEEWWGPACMWLPFKWLSMRRPRTNVLRAEQLVAGAVEVGAQLVHLSECFKLVYRKGQRLWRTA